MRTKINWIAFFDVFLVDSSMDSKNVHITVELAYLVLYNSVDQVLLGSIQLDTHIRYIYPSFRMMKTN